MTCSILPHLHTIYDDIILLNVFAEIITSARLCTSSLRIVEDRKNVEAINICNAMSILPFPSLIKSAFVGVVNNI